VVTSLGHGFWRVQLRYGFMEVPDVPAALERCRAQGLDIDSFQVSYFLSREIIVPSPRATVARWRHKLFAAMSRNASSVADFFRLPDNCVVELGTRIQL
jgi:KUP system potassium uptake protein